jgi:hypothetical protein
VSIGDYVLSGGAVAALAVLDSNRMSALGQKRTFSNVRLMSALPPKADILGHGPQKSSAGLARNFPLANFYSPQSALSLAMSV